MLIGGQVIYWGVHTLPVLDLLCVDDQLIGQFWAENLQVGAIVRTNGMEIAKSSVRT